MIEFMHLGYHGILRIPKSSLSPSIVLGTAQVPKQIDHLEMWVIRILNKGGGGLVKECEFQFFRKRRKV